jgi:hypothetical protein
MDGSKSRFKDCLQQSKICKVWLGLFDHLKILLWTSRILKCFRYSTLYNLETNRILYVSLKRAHVIFLQSVKVEFQASANSTMIDVETAKHVELLHSTLNPKSNNSLFGFLNRFRLMLFIQK